MQHGELRSCRGSKLVNEFFLRFLSFNFKDTNKTGEALFYTSSSSSCSSPTATSSDNEIREREDRTENDTSPVLVSSFNVDDRTGQPVVGRESNHEPVHQANQKFTKTIKKETVIERGNSHASSSHEASLEPIYKRREDLGKHSVETHFPKDRNCEICKRTKNYKGPMQKTQWRSRTWCWQIWWLDNSRSQDPQWQLRISKQSSICSRCAGLRHSMDPSVSV